MEKSLSFLECAAASRPWREHSPIGDRWLALPHAGGTLLVVLDASGHGAEAAEAAARALAILSERPERSLTDRIRSCHERMLGTRGVALSLAAVDPSRSSLTWLGVGSVQGVLVRAGAASRPASSTLVLRPGIVGRRLPPLVTETLPMAAGDLLVFATDGISPEFAADSLSEGTAQLQADHLLRRHFRGNDDGLVVAAVFWGGSR